MNKYEIMLLTRTELDEETRGAIVERAKDAVTKNGGSWGKVADWGRRKTAYPIAKQNEAHYQVLEFDSAPAALDEAVRVLRITEGVMRLMATNRVPEYPEGARAKLERITDEDLASSSRDRGRGRGGRSGGRGRD